MDLTDDQLRWLAYMASYHWDIGCAVDPPLDPALESLLDLHLLNSWCPEDRDGNPNLEVMFTDKGRAAFEAVDTTRKARAFIKCGSYLFATWAIADLSLGELPEFLIHEDLMIRQAAGRRLQEVCSAQEVTPFR